MRKNTSKIILTFISVMLYQIAIAHIGIASVKGTDCNSSVPSGEVKFIINGSAGPFRYEIINALNGTIVKSGTVIKDNPNIITETGLGSGDYTLIVLNDYNADCKKQIRFKIDCCSNNSPIDLSGQVQQLSSTGGNINIKVPQGTYFLWSKQGDPNFKSTNQNLTDVSNGTYCVTVTNGTCQEKSACFKLGDCSIDLVTKVTVSGNCLVFGTKNNGNITIEVGKGTAPYNVKWSNGASDLQLFNLSNGKYTVTVTDAKQCVSTKEIEVKDRTSLELKPIQGCADEKASIELIVTSQMANTTNPNLTYQWEGKATGFKATTKNISNLEKDEYRVTVFGDGCPSPIVSNWVSVSNSDLFINFTTTPKTSFANGSVTFSLTGTDPINYSFNQQPLTKGNGTTISDLAPGVYPLKVINGAGCVKEVLITILDCENLDIEQAFDIKATITNKCPFAVKFDFPTKGLAGIKVTETPFQLEQITHKNGIDIIQKIKSRACLKIEVSQDILCSPDYPFGTVLAQQCVEPSCSYTQGIEGTCDDRKLKIEIDGLIPCKPLVYEWEHSDENASIVDLPTGINRTSVTVSDANGCTQVKIFEFNPFDGSFIGNLCEGENKACITLNLSNKSAAPYLVKYKDKDGVVKDAIDPSNICNLKEGVYEVIVTDAFGCSYTKTFTIPPYRNPLKVGYAVTPAQTNKSSDGSITISITSGNPSYTFTLTNYKDFTETKKNTTQLTHLYTNLKAGDYYLSIKDSLNCVKDFIITVYYCKNSSDSTSQDLIITPLYEVNNPNCINSILSASFTYNGVTKKLSVNVKGAPLMQCKFRKGGTVIFTKNVNQVSENFIINDVQVGKYYFEVEELGGCNQLYSVEIKDVTINTNVVDIGDIFWKAEADIKHINSFCTSGSITLKPFPAGFNPNVKYEWEYPDGTYSISQNLSNLSKPGTYKLTITDTSCDDKTFKYSFVLNKDSIQELTYTVKPICASNEKGCVNFNITPFQQFAPFEYRWQDLSTGIETKGTSNNICDLKEENYKFWIIAKDGCSQEKNISIKSSANFTLTLEGNIVDATDCSSADGNYIVTNLITVGGVEPLKYEWFVGSTKIATVKRPFILNQLKTGTYILKVTDANGCTRTKSFTIGYKNDISANFETLVEPCGISPVGEIQVTASPSKIGGYNYQWLTPLSQLDKNVTASTHKNLKAGTYYVRIYHSSDSLKCSKQFSYQLKSTSFTSNDITAKIINPCKGKANGSIALNTEKFKKPYTITWADPIPDNYNNNFAQLNIGAGTYQVTVKDGCGNIAVKVFELKEVGAFDIVKVQGPDCKVSLKPILSNYNLPVTYIWQNGFKTTELDPTKANVPNNTTKYTITVRDANGCTNTATIDGFSTWNIAKFEACAGATGQMKINIFNPSNDSMSVFLLQNQVLTPYPTKYDPNNANWYYTDLITGINAGMKIPVTVKIGQCKTTDTVEFKTLPSTKKFNGVVKSGKDKGKCIYQEYCHPNFLKDDKGDPILYYEAGKYTVEDCDRFITCPNLENPNMAPFKFKDSSYDKRMTYGEVVSFLELEKINNPSNYAVIDAQIQGIFKRIEQSEADYAWCLSNAGTQLDSNSCQTKLMSLCAHTRFCPLTYVYYGFEVEVTTNFSFSILSNDDKPTPSNSNCYSYKCSGVVKEACPETPNGYLGTLNPTIDNCKPDQQTMAQLYIWYNDLMTNPKYIKFRTSELKDLLDANVNNPKINCAKVTYCKSDFTIKVAPKFNKILCNIPPVKGIKVCKIDTLGAIGRIYCFNGWYDGSKTAFYYLTEPITFNGVFPGFKGINTQYVTTRLLASKINTKFDKFAFVKNTPNSLLKDEFGRYYYYNYVEGEKNMMFDYESNNSLIYTNHDESSNVTVYSLVKNKSEVLNYYKENGISWDKIISSDSLLIKEFFVDETNNVNIAGFTKGKLYLNTTEIFSTDSLSAFTLSFKNDGEINHSHLLSNIDIENTRFYREGNNFSIVTINNYKNLILDSNPFVLKNEKSLINVNFEKKEVIEFDKGFENFKLGKALISKGNNLVFLLAKKDSKTPNVTYKNYYFKNDDVKLVSLNLQTNKINWVNEISNKDINISTIDFVIDEKSNTYLSTTFKENLFYQNLDINSNGGKDIFISKIDNIGNILHTWHYGSEDDETISKMTIKNNRVIFGGEVFGSTWERKIGETNFLCYNNDIDYQAYMSYIIDPKEGQNESRKISNYPESDLNNSNWILKVLPNPFTNNVSILIEDSFNEIYNIKVFDIIGKVRYQDTKISSKGLNIFEANLPQNLEEGIYFVQVKNSKGEIKIQKIVKQ